MELGKAVFGLSILALAIWALFVGLWVITSIWGHLLRWVRGRIMLRKYNHLDMNLSYEQKEMVKIYSKVGKKS